MKNLFDLIKLNNAKLPGAIAHTTMAPKFSNRMFRNTTPSADARKSAVVIPVYSDNYKDNFSFNNIQILFTRRSLTLKNHPGQLCFPGGGLEPNESPYQAAIRELDEEVGIKEKNIEFLCELSQLYVEPSNNIIYPFACKINTKEINLYTKEVESIHYMNLSYFIDNNNVSFQKRIIDNNEILIPFWEIGCEVPLWGATAMILNEFIELIKQLSNV